MKGPCQREWIFWVGLGAYLGLLVFVGIGGLIEWLKRGNHKSFRKGLEAEREDSVSGKGLALALFCALLPACSLFIISLLFPLSRVEQLTIILLTYFLSIPLFQFGLGRIKEKSRQGVKKQKVAVTPLLGWEIFSQLLLAVGNISSFLMGMGPIEPALENAKARFFSFASRRRGKP